jgi:hypothetical protein
MAFRVVVAFVSGILSGALVEALSQDKGQAEADERHCHECEERSKGGLLARALRYGFVTLARDIGRAMLLGILVAGVLTALVPEDFFTGRFSSGIVAMFLMMVIGIPMYVCSTGSIPVAFALMSIGISPGAALVFLVSGPATNAAAVAMVWKDLGRQSTMIYLLVIAVCSLAAGLLLDQVVARGASTGPIHLHGEGVGWFGTLCAIVLVGVLAPSVVRRKKSS